MTNFIQYHSNICLLTMSQISLQHLTVALVAIFIFPHNLFAQSIFSFRKNYERIVTNLDAIYSPDGVPIDYNYNETMSNSPTSSPGCPKSITGLPWIYYGNPNRCFLAHQIGPCRNGEKLLSQNESVYGICGCECMTLEPEKYSCLKESKERYLSCTDYAGEVSFAFPQGQVFDTKEQKCYAKFDRGPCVNDGEVIATYTTDYIKCLPFCGLEDPLWYDKYNKGICTVQAGGGSLAGGLPAESCKEKYKYSKILNKCVRQFTFKF